MLRFNFTRLHSLSSNIFLKSLRKTNPANPNSFKQINFFQSRKFLSNQPLNKQQTVSLTFLSGDGSKQIANAKVGDSLLDTVINNDIDIDGFGACEGTLACSTCHLIFSESNYKRLPEQPTDEELDLLDLAYGLTDTSRLGCQVIVTPDMEGIEITIPASTADVRDT